MEEELAKSPSQRVPCKKNRKCSHHPVLQQGSACVLKTAEKIFPGVFGGFVRTKISLPKDADLCGCSRWSRLQKWGKDENSFWGENNFGGENNFWGEHHGSRASLASQRGSAGLCGVFSPPPRFFRCSLFFPSASSMDSSFLPVPSPFLTRELLLEPSLPFLGCSDLPGKGGKMSIQPCRIPAHHLGNPNFPSAPSHGEDALYWRWLSFLPLTKKTKKKTLSPKHFY